MNAQTHRLEIRADGELLSTIDNWSAIQSDAPNRSEAVRRLIQKGVGGADAATFETARLSILQLATHSDTEILIQDSTLFAWGQRVFPMREEARPLAEVFENHFTATKHMMSDLFWYLEDRMTNQEYVTFYDLEDHFGIRTLPTQNNGWDRHLLTQAFKYFKYEEYFDADFWEKLMENGGYPTEASGILRNFDRKNYIRNLII